MPSDSDSAGLGRDPRRGDKRGVCRVIAENSDSGLTNCKYAGSSHIILNSGLTNCKYYVVCWVITTGRILVQEFEEITGSMSGHPHEDLILDSGF